MSLQPTSTAHANSIKHLEIACFDVPSLLLADRAPGTDRTEFCADRSSGGITPALADVQAVLPQLRKPVRVMIRPRAGDFVYSDEEFEGMKRDVTVLKSPSASIAVSGGKGMLDGFVFGILDPHHRVDVPRNTELAALAGPFSCTFHRAFDQTADLDEALEDIVACGFETVLTSGGEVDAVAGAEVLERLVVRSRGRITVMPGGGVRSRNVGMLLQKTGAEWWHSSAVVGEEISGEEILALKGAIRSFK